MRWVKSFVVLIVFLCGMTSAHAAIPLMINHQGLVKVNAVPFTGNGLFKFGFVDGVTGLWLWTNDGTHVGQLANTVSPDTAVTLPVNNGIYDVRLGDIAFTNMVFIPSTVFNGPDAKLRVIFNDGSNGWQLLSPDQAVTATAYAYHAAKSDIATLGLFASAAPGALDGGIIKNDQGDIINDLAITEVWCSDSTNTYSIHVSAKVKRVDAAWQAGTNQGGFDTGTIGTLSDIIYIWAIGDSTGTLAPDFLLSRDDTDPTLPAGYNIKRLLGARKWLGTKWAKFTTIGKGREKWVSLLDAEYMKGQQPPTTSWTLYDCSYSVPVKIARLIHVYAVASQDSDAPGITIRVRPTGGNYDQGAVFIRGPYSGAANNAVGATGMLPLSETGTFEWHVDAVLGTGILEFVLMGYAESL